MHICTLHTDPTTVPWLGAFHTLLLAPNTSYPVHLIPPHHCPRVQCTCCFGTHQDCGVKDITLQHIRLVLCEKTNSDSMKNTIKVYRFTDTQGFTVIPKKGMHSEARGNKWIEQIIRQCTLDQIQVELLIRQLHQQEFFESGQSTD